MGKGDVGGWVLISDVIDDICELRSYATLQVMDISRYPKSLRKEHLMVYLVHAWRAAGFSLYGPKHFVWEKVMWMGGW